MGLEESFAQAAATIENGLSSDRAVSAIRVIRRLVFNWTSLSEQSLLSSSTMEFTGQKMSSLSIGWNLLDSDLAGFPPNFHSKIRRVQSNLTLSFDHSPLTPPIKQEQKSETEDRPYPELSLFSCHPSVAVFSQRPAARSRGRCVAVSRASQRTALSGAEGGKGTEKRISRISPGCGLFLISGMELAELRSNRGDEHGRLARLGLDLTVTRASRQGPRPTDW